MEVSRPTKQQGLRMETNCSPSKLTVLGMEQATSSLKVPVCSTNKKSRKRKVRFALNFVVESSDSSSCDSNYLDEQDIHNLWWSRKDFDSIMSKAMLVAGEARHQTIVATGLSQAFQLAVRTTSIMGHESQLGEHLKTMQEEHRGLKLWCQYGHGRRGLEKYTSRQYNEVRRKQMHKLYKRVLALSQQGADPEDIRHVAERTSRVSVVFARMLAVADSNAADHLHFATCEPQSAIVVGSAKQYGSPPVLSVKRISPVNHAPFERHSNR